MSGKRKAVTTKKPLTQPLSQRFEGRARNKHQRLIVKVHGLLKQRRNVDGNASLSDGERQAQLAAIERELEALGGMEAYQSASKRGEKHLNAAQWVARAVAAHTTPQQRQRGLWAVDVGALEPNYARWPWINSVSLDLTKRHPFVLELDFLRAKLGTLWAICQRQALRRHSVSDAPAEKRRRVDRDDDDDDEQEEQEDDEQEEHEADDDGADEVDYYVTADSQPSDDIVPDNFAGFDLIVMSLVLNFEPSAEKRGQMLCKARSLLAEKGFVAVVLPLATIDHSRFFDESALMDLMARLEFANLVLHRSPKLFYALFRLRDGAAAFTVPAFLPMPRRKVRHSKDLNNFFITL
jgi:hypothetical protein